MTIPQLDELKAVLAEIHDIQAAGSVLNWDQETYMPPGGAEARGRQMGTLARISMEKFIAPRTGDLIAAVLERADELPEGSDDAALIRFVDHEYQRIKRIPPHRYAAIVEHGSNTYPVWAKARSENDFRIVAPNLERTLELSRELSSYFPGREHVMDPLIDYADRGMTVASIRKVFTELRAELVPLVAAIQASGQVEDDFLRRRYPEEDQVAFGLSIVRKFGFDDQRIRQDRARHPFMARISADDLRITTRYQEHDFSDGFFSTMHETGHALYELGIDPALDRTPLATGTSAGVHESQSRLWENLVGRSRTFWEFTFPLARQAFPAALGDVSMEAFYRAINRVQPSLIRTDADEVTYNLHVMIRFDLEVAMLEGKLEIVDLPGAWRDRYKADLGLEPPDDSSGVLQDVHWFSDIIGGGFQGYTLGNIMAAQFFSAALQAHPEIPDELRRGKFDTLHGWLRENIYRHGSKYTPEELLQRATGSGLNSRPLMAYLREKYGEIYGLNSS